MVNLSVSVCGVPLRNPVVPASGTFGYGREFAGLYDLDLLGSISIKGTTEAPRLGNPLPRIAETPAGMLNAVGLQNPGVDAVLSEELPWLAEHFHGPVVANVGGFSPDEYARSARRLAEAPNVGFLEINVSCPNVHACGRNFGSEPASAAAVTAAVRAVTDKPVLLKLSPNAGDVVAVAHACADAGADGFTLVNTVLGMRIDLRTRRPVLANRIGGLSGPAILPIAVRIVHDVYAATRLPIFGCGGVSMAEDVCELMMAGACAVQVGAANLRDPMACPRILAELPAVCELLGVGNIAELTGASVSSDQ